MPADEEKRAAQKEQGRQAARDILAILGSVAFLYGCKQIYEPLMWLAGGVLFMVAAVYGSRPRGNRSG